MEDVSEIIHKTHTHVLLLPFFTGTICYHGFSHRFFVIFNDGSERYGGLRGDLRLTHGIGQGEDDGPPWSGLARLHGQHGLNHFLAPGLNDVTCF